MFYQVFLHLSCSLYWEENKWNKDEYIYTIGARAYIFFLVGFLNDKVGENVPEMPTKYQIQKKILWKKELDCQI